MPFANIAVAVVGLIVLVILLAILIVTRYRVAGPNEAYIVTGKKGKEIRDAQTGALSQDPSIRVRKQI